jgi:regulator of nucleoside diphosphate kinase
MQVTKIMRQSRNANSPVITIDDRRRLGNLIVDGDLCADPQVIRELEDRLDEAVYVGCKEAPRSLITMNSTLQLAEADSQNTRLLTLTYPDDAEFIDDSVSVLEPLGMALLGPSVGDVVECVEGSCTTDLKIQRIVYQPEHSAARPR